MPSYIDIEEVLLRWQAKHQRHLTYADIAAMTGISVKALYRMMSGQMTMLDGQKIIPLCRTLECEPSEILHIQK